MKSSSSERPKKVSWQINDERLKSKPKYNLEKVSWQLNSSKNSDQQLPLYNPAISCFLEEIYAECNRSERLELDPLAIVKRYKAREDMEIAGLICSTLAFGSVELIMRACEKALEPLGEHPAKTLREMARKEIKRAWSFFKYRFCFPKDMIALMWAIHDALNCYGSLEALFLECDRKWLQEKPEEACYFAANQQEVSKYEIFTGRHESLSCKMSQQQNILAASSMFVRKMHELALEAVPEGLRKNLLPDPANGSAAKRLFLFLRWMVRRDEIDPGCWNGVSPSRLIVPMDTHMIRTCTERLGFLPQRKIQRKSGVAVNLRDALRVTDAFRLYAPEDPVKYDFALTRPGIDPHPGDERFLCL